MVSMMHAEDVERFHEQILEAACSVVRTKRHNEFTAHEVVFRLKTDFPEFTEGAIRAGIVARAGADFERVGPYAYRLVSLSQVR